MLFYVCGVREQAAWRGSIFHSLSVCRPFSSATFESSSSEAFSPAFPDDAAAASSYNIHANKWISVSRPGLWWQNQHCPDLHWNSSCLENAGCLSGVCAVVENRIIRLILCTMRTQPRHRHSNQVLNSIWRPFCIFPARVVLIQSSSWCCWEFVDKLSGTPKVRAGLSAF